MGAVAIIPARGGSKRVPRKNVRPFGGKPMIAWPISTALKSGLFEEVVVSTDDEEIASIAETYGASVPFRRPAELADDHTPTLPVIAHALRWLEERRSAITFACCVYATAPFLRTEHLSQGLALLQRHPTADFAFSVTSYAFPIFRALKHDADGSVSMFWPEHELTRSQDLPKAWHDAAQFYWGRPQAFHSSRGIFSARSFAVPLPRHLVQDIDSEEDWQRAELMFAAAHADMEQLDA